VTWALPWVLVFVSWARQELGQQVPWGHYFERRWLPLLWLRRLLQRRWLLWLLRLLH